MGMTRYMAVMDHVTTFIRHYVATQLNPNVVLPKIALLPISLGLGDFLGNTMIMITVIHNLIMIILLNQIMMNVTLEIAHMLLINHMLLNLNLIIMMRQIGACTPVFQTKLNQDHQ